jgi:DMSO reductase family type II enzyme heme b subunit
VRAYHDAKDAYFLLEWEDDVEGRAHDVGEFPDGIAVGFSLADEPPSESIMMGFQSLMNMWLWKANLDEKFWSTAGPPESNSPNVHYNYEEQADFSASTSEIKSACQELLAARAGSLTPKDETEVSGRGRWRDGKWRVVLKRALSTDDQEESVQFTPREIHIALAVWDGDKGDRGSRKSISEWIILRMGAAPNEVSAANQKEQPREIAILARRFKYEPGKITLKKGELVTFRLESADVTHGLYLDGYGIDIKARPGKVGKVTFRADKTGRFSFRCSETCGEFHPYMIGYLTVEPNSRFHLFVLGTLGASVVIALVASVERSKRKETAEDV